jgi:hypothetical protein
MGTGPTEVETLHILRDVMGAEPGALGEDGLKLESRADMGVEAVFKVHRGEEKFADEVFA